MTLEIKRLHLASLQGVGAVLRHQRRRPAELSRMRRESGDLYDWFGLMERVHFCHHADVVHS